MDPLATAAAPEAPNPVDPAAASSATLATSGVLEDLRRTPHTTPWMAVAAALRRMLRGTPGRVVAGPLRDAPDWI